jgi:hypothetical protein
MLNPINKDLFMMGKLKNNQSGFGVVEALLILVIVAIVGGTGFYVYQAQQNTNKALTSDSSTTPNFKKKTTKAASSSSQNTTATAANILKIPELGVQLTIPASLSKVTYAALEGRTGEYGVTDARLLAENPPCTAQNAPLGRILVADTAFKNEGGVHGYSQKLSNGKYFQILHNSGAACEDQTQSASANEAEDSDAFLGVLTTVKLID